MDTLHQNRELNLETIKIIPFLMAIENEDPSIISSELTKPQFELLAQEFIDSGKDIKSPVEQRIENRKAKMRLVSSCLLYLRSRPGDEEILKVLADNGVKIDFDTYFEDIKKGYALHQKWEFLNKQDKSKTPDGNTTKKKKQTSEKNSIFDMLTSLSTGLELSLDFQNMVVREFISYRSALSRKRDMLEKAKPKANTNGRRR